MHCHQILLRISSCFCQNNVHWFFLSSNLSFSVNDKIGTPSVYIHIQWVIQSKWLILNIWQFYITKFSMSVKTVTVPFSRRSRRAVRPLQQESVSPFEWKVDTLNFRRLPHAWWSYCWAPHSVSRLHPTSSSIDVHHEEIRHRCVAYSFTHSNEKLSWVFYIYRRMLLIWREAQSKKAACRRVENSGL